MVPEKTSHRPGTACVEKKYSARTAWCNTSELGSHPRRGHFRLQNFTLPNAFFVAFLGLFSTKQKSNQQKNHRSLAENFRTSVGLWPFVHVPRQELLPVDDEWAFLHKRFSKFET